MVGLLAGLNRLGTLGLPKCNENEHDLNSCREIRKWKTMTIQI